MADQCGPPHQEAEGARIQQVGLVEHQLVDLIQNGHERQCGDARAHAPALDDPMEGFQGRKDHPSPTRGRAVCAQIVESP
jgi:hypothetical protein